MEDLDLTKKDVALRNAMEAFAGYIAVERKAQAVVILAAMDDDGTSKYYDLHKVLGGRRLCIMNMLANALEASVDLTKKDVELTNAMEAFAGYIVAEFKAQAIVILAAMDGDGTSKYYNLHKVLGGRRLYIMNMLVDTLKDLDSYEKIEDNSEN